MEPAHKTLTLTVPNGVLKKNHHHQQQHHQPQQQQVRAAVAVYRECLKNHAASLGGHAVDGCGEFMASPSSNPSDPTSLTCAACGCHRNFHRRIPLNPQLHHHPQPLSSEKQHNDEEEDDDNNNNNEGEDDGQDQEEDPDPDEIDDANDGETGENSSAPHMLLALSAGVATQPQPQPQPQSDIHRRIIEQQMQQQNGNREAHQPPHPPPVPIISSNNSRKRFRTKFSPEQKERMQDLSERLGWKMQKRDEGLVEERCREIGIGKGVFKVWMHNNKHNFLHSSSRSNFTAVTVPVATDGVAPSISTLTPLAAPMSDDSDGNGNPIGRISVRVNGSAAAVS